MIIFWETLKKGSGNSTDPGVQNVLAGVTYEINNIPLIGTLNRTVQQIAQATIVGQSSAAVLGGQSLNAVLVET